MLDVETTVLGIHTVSPAAAKAMEMDELSLARYAVVQFSPMLAMEMRAWATHRRSVLEAEAKALAKVVQFYSIVALATCAEQLDMLVRPADMPRTTSISRRHPAEEKPGE